MIFLDGPPSIGTTYRSELVLMAGDLVGIHRVADFLAVGRDGVVVRTAERKRRHVAFAGREILWPCRPSHGTTIRWLRRLRLPLRPVAIEQDV